jgi:hypothetical protein
MTPKDIENFIKDNNLVKFNTFAIKNRKNIEYYQLVEIVEIDSQMSGFYEDGVIKEDVRLPVELWDLFNVFECIIFDCGNLIMCSTETWDGWQPSITLEKYYKTDYMKDIF